jgi:aminoglycoside N3'-acetyltransferase
MKQYLNKKVRWLSKQSFAKTRLMLFRSWVAKQYSDYETANFISGLKQVGIVPGDSVFVMYSQDKIYLKTGKLIPVKSVLNDLIDYLGKDGTLMALCFPIERNEIAAKKKKFNVQKSATECGIFSETLRRRRGSVRSLSPIFNSISYGKNSSDFSKYHHLSPYPFGVMSPYYKLMEDGGKYLGIGVGFEAFTPCHMIEDHFKCEFKHKIYCETPDEYSVILPDGSLTSIICYNRDPITFPKDGYDPLYYFRLLNIASSEVVIDSGIKLFTFKIQDFFDAAVKIYESKKITVWDTGSLHFWVRRKIRRIGRHFLISKM